jgi:hypothetical protein
VKSERNPNIILIIDNIRIFNNFTYFLEKIRFIYFIIFNKRSQMRNKILTVIIYKTLQFIIGKKIILNSSCNTLIYYLIKLSKKKFVYQLLKLLQIQSGSLVKKHDISNKYTIHLHPRRFLH